MHCFLVGTLGKPCTCSWASISSSVKWGLSKRTTYKELRRLGVAGGVSQEGCAGVRTLLIPFFGDIWVLAPAPQCRWRRTSCAHDLSPCYKIGSNIPPEPFFPAWIHPKVEYPSLMSPLYGIKVGWLWAFPGGTQVVLMGGRAGKGQETREDWGWQEEVEEFHHKKLQGSQQGGDGAESSRWRRKDKKSRNRTCVHGNSL